MIRNVMRPWYEVWGTEEAQNRFLKGLLAFFVVLSSVETIALTCLSLRTPILIAVTPTNSQALSIAPLPKDLLESEVKRAVSKYVGFHHSWEWSNIDAEMKKASLLVSPTLSSKFLERNGNQVKIAKEKKLSQKFFVGSVEIDLPAKIARVRGERILILEGLRAVNPMTLEVQFEYGARNEANPEGVYVTAEDLTPEANPGK